MKNLKMKCFEASFYHELNKRVWKSLSSFFLFQKKCFGVFLLFSVFIFSFFIKHSFFYKNQLTAVLAAPSTSQLERKPGELRKSLSHSSMLKKNKKMGVGVGASGVYGLFGAGLELNLTSKASFQLGFGKGPHYQTFHAQIKRSVNGKWLSPYLAGGYSIWYTNDQSEDDLKKTTPPFLTKKFLKSNDFKEGHFAEHIIYSSMGLQYFQIRNPWAGLSFYGEFNFLVNTDDFIRALTGGLGVMYYF